MHAVYNTHEHEPEKYSHAKNQVHPSVGTEYMPAKRFNKTLTHSVSDRNAT